jgi:hypothetical protein
MNMISKLFVRFIGLEREREREREGERSSIKKTSKVKNLYNTSNVQKSTRKSIQKNHVDLRSQHHRSVLDFLHCHNPFLFKMLPAV